VGRLQDMTLSERPTRYCEVVLTRDHCGSLLLSEVFD